MKEHLKDWGNLYQILSTLVFGFITIILWIQDRKKSKLILELQKQSNVLISTLDILQNQDRPCLKIVDKKDFDFWPKLRIENIGRDMYGLVYNPKSENENFEISPANQHSVLSRSNNFDVTLQTKDRKTPKKDKIKFEFQDKLGNHFEQYLYLSTRVDEIAFEPLKEQKR